MRYIIKITKSSRIPLIGCIAFGVIDRGTNLIQVRPTTVCNLNCCFCSTAAGMESIAHNIDYIVEADYLLDWVNWAARFKGPIEVLIDSVGEPATYPELIKLIKGLRAIKEIKRVSMETNGTLLTKKKITELKEAGLDQINLSLHSLDEGLARQLAGASYNINQILQAINFILENKIDLLIAPVWLHGINDDEIIKIIKLAKAKGLKLAIQKYEAHKYGRKINIKKQTWYGFYKQLKQWELAYDIKLVYRSVDLGITPAKRIPLAFEKRAKVNLIVACRGWHYNQMIGIAKERCISINNCSRKIGDKTKVRILENKNNIYIATTY